MAPKDLPLHDNKHFAEPSAFTPESLLREARRQKGGASAPVPTVCLLDPDGDVVRRLLAEGRAQPHTGWVCYHTELYVFEYGGMEFGVVGCAVGAPFAVLVAEELFASGCGLLVSVTSAGQLAPVAAPPYFVRIDYALRDEGSSYHYQPADDAYSHAPGDLLQRLDGAFDDLGSTVHHGGSWTTDAPFRETESAIQANRERGLLTVEMEAAGLYAFAAARRRPVICFAHVTNQMGQIEGDFEKGEADGVTATLQLVARCGHALADNTE